MTRNNKKVVAIVLGGGRGTRLYPLTMDRSKPAVPFAGKYRLVDIPISNCINSNIRQIYVLTQFNSASLQNPFELYQSSHKQNNKIIFPQSQFDSHIFSVFC